MYLRLRSILLSSILRKTRRQAATTITTMTPAKITSVGKWRPKTTRKLPSAVAKPTTAISATGLMLGGVTLAGARSQKASVASPDTKEQLLRQSPPGFHHGL